jgi:2-methylisocitrate lyase-like PEP mutase family enzyme
VIIWLNDAIVEQVMTGKIAEFRRLHEAPGAFIVPNPWDVGSARILAKLGFKALATTSAGMAFAMGMQEGTVSKEDALAHCRMIVEATALPVSGDLERGYGDSPEDVAQTIRDAAAAGLAGGSIEDHTGRPDDPIFEFSLAVERIQAAAEAARALPEDFVMTARAENFLWDRPDLDDTIKRLQAFEKAGADVLFAPGLRDIESIRSVCSSVGKPVNVIMGLPGLNFGFAEAAEAGAKRISVGSALARLAYGSLMEAGREMRDEGTIGIARNAVGFAEIDAVFAR